MIAGLQRAAGNRAVADLMRRPAPMRLLQREHDVTESDRDKYSRREKNPWPEEKLDKLGKWSPSDDIFHGFAAGDASDWAKVAGLYPTADTLLEYQTENTRTKVLKSGHVTYMGKSGLEWEPHTSKRDWSGLYLGETLEHAERYVADGLEAGEGRGSIWKVTLNRDLPVIETTGTFTSSGEVGENAKAAVLKEVVRRSFADLGIGEKLWIKGLGEAGYGYYGDDAGGVHELIVPWELVNSYLTYTRLYTYTTKGYVPKRDKG